MSLYYSSLKGFKMSHKVDKDQVRIYARDGMGRDNYIGFGNGGNTFEFEPGTHGYMLNSTQANQYTPGSALFTGKGQAGSRKDLYPINGHKYINYHANGGGRDGYIAQENGGFYPTKELAQYKQNFVDQLRQPLSKHNPESTSDYLVKRNRRMKSFLSGDRQLELMVADQCGLRGQIRLDDPLRLTNGFIINQQHVAEANKKTCFQTQHSDFLSQPKKQWEKYETVQSKIDLLTDANRCSSKSLKRQAGKKLSNFSTTYSNFKDTRKNLSHLKIDGQRPSLGGNKLRGLYNRSSSNADGFYAQGKDNYGFYTRGKHQQKSDRDLLAKPRGSMGNIKIDTNPGNSNSKHSFGELYNKNKKIILTENLERLLKNSKVTEKSTKGFTDYHVTKGGSFGKMRDTSGSLGYLTALDNINRSYEELGNAPAPMVSMSPYALKSKPDLQRYETLTDSETRQKLRVPSKLLADDNVKSFLRRLSQSDAREYHP